MDGLQLGERGLKVEKRFTFAAYRKALTTLVEIDNRVRWWLADLLMWGESRFGESHPQAVEESGLHPEAARSLMWIGTRYPLGDRHPDLTFTHHSQIAFIESSDDRQSWLNRAAEDGSSPGELRASVNVLETNKKEATAIVFALTFDNGVTVLDYDVLREEILHLAREFEPDKIRFRKVKC